METWSKGLDFRQLGDRFGTPIYVFHAEQLRKNFCDYLTIVEQPQHIAYPIKTNPSLEVLRHIYRLGGSAECSSMSEVNLAQTAGFSAERIVFNSPAAEVEVAIELLQKGCMVVADSVEVLQRLDDYYSDSMLGSLLVRVNPNFPIEYAHIEEWQTVTAHASCTAKFGIPSEELVSILKHLTIPVSGLHVHVGTQMDNLQSFVNITTFLHGLMDEIHADTHHKIRFLDLGGGLGIDFVEGDRYPTIRALAAQLAPLKRDGITYLIEPGQSLVGNAIGLLTKVVTVKQIRGKRWAILDVGSDQLIKITLLKWHHQMLTADHQPLPLQGNDAIGGPLCFSGDTLLPTTNLDGICAGDYLFIQHCGAYCYAVSNHFNGRFYGGMIKQDEDGEWVICNHRETESLTSIYSTYCWKQDGSLWEAPQDIDLDIANQLSSRYLQHQMGSDRYDIVSFQQQSETCFEFDFAVHSEVGFVSMPFATRLIADATIISVLYAVGKDQKDISVWGDELVLRCSQQIRSNRILKCQIALSPIISGDRRRAALAQFSLDNGKFAGHTRPVFRL